MSLLWIAKPLLKCSVLVYSAYSFHANPNVHEMNKRFPFYLYALLVPYSIFISKFVFLSFSISTLFILSTNICSIPWQDEAPKGMLPSQDCSQHDPQVSFISAFLDVPLKDAWIFLKAITVMRGKNGLLNYGCLLWAWLGGSLPYWLWEWEDCAPRESNSYGFWFLLCSLQALTWSKLLLSQSFIICLIVLNEWTECQHLRVIFLSAFPRLYHPGICKWVRTLIMEVRLECVLLMQAHQSVLGLLGGLGEL